MSDLREALRDCVAFIRGDIQGPMQRRGILKDAEAALSAQPQPEAVEPTHAQINSACMSYRHDYGLLPPDLRTRTRFEAIEWLRAWQKEGFGTAPPLAPDARMRRALEECVNILELVEQPAIRDTDYIEEVSALGERIGFGALMSAASAEWRASLIDDGLPTGGEFVAGPCHATVLSTMKLAREALSSADEGKESEGIEALAQYKAAIDRVNRSTDREINAGPSDPTPAEQREELHPGWLADDVAKASDRIAEWSTTAEQREAVAQWPDGCRNPNSCSIHRDCMYLQCKHYERDISGEVDRALSTRAGG